MPATRTPPPKRSASPLVERLRGAGIVAPRTAVREAERAGLALELACALLEKESSGGRNVFGHDPTIFAGAGSVTRANYAEYKRRRLASGNKLMQGVGPCQLTWWELQDAADADGGCWHPEINMRVGFRHLATLVERYGRADGARRYNGSGPAAEAYSRDLLAKAHRWEEIVAGPEAEAPANGSRRARRAEPARAQRPAAQRPGAERPAAERPGAERPAVATPAAARPAERGVRAMAADLRRLEDESGAAWRALVARGHRRRRRLLAERAERGAAANGHQPEGLTDLLAALARIEGRLGTLVTLSEHRADPAAPDDTPPSAPSNGTAATPTQLSAKAPAAPSAAAMLRELEELDARRRELQDELIERYVEADEQLAKLLGERQPAAARNGATPRTGTAQRNGATPRTGTAQRNGAAPRDGRDRRDPLGGRSADTIAGERGLFVRRSKVALARYLAQKGTAEHAALRHRLRREAAAPRNGDVASAAWTRGVEAVQRVAGRPVTGELDGELVQLLLPFWPRDGAVKRIVRSTPAWRTIPGQISPNFNLKELACSDRAHTPYVIGLMREQGLTKAEARERAKELARRLERLRRLGGDRPLLITSAFRTKAYNAQLSGAATNSAHTRGFAVDTPPPRGVSLTQHRAHVLDAFECGVGYYPRGRGYFVHGDFDHTLGGRRTW
ncbi:MAG TPA: D-Ala-D-Ala carboxypeptidase family metallohydrolase [Solirubrobacteraceae bacterium]|nr:D-Ala-D-Ala carboxypeptidase family metallohydrolase [Solirubrobacteraceae bacterium]